MSYKGRYKVKNPQKYRGDPTNVIYRSSLELKLMNYLDTHPDVLEWSSEEFFVPYISPIDGRYHRYFPDFSVKRRDKNGNIDKIVIEIKPSSQTRPPEKKSRVTPRYITEVKNWGINNAKWKACKQFCDDRNWKFQILTEREINGYNY